MNIFSQAQTKSHTGTILFLFFHIETILYKQIRAEVSKQTDFPRGNMHLNAKDIHLRPSRMEMHTIREHTGKTQKYKINQA